MTIFTPNPCEKKSSIYPFFIRTVISHTTLAIAAAWLAVSPAPSAAADPEASPSDEMPLAPVYAHPSASPLNLAKSLEKPQFINSAPEIEQFQPEFADFSLPKPVLTKLASEIDSQEVDSSSASHTLGAEPIAPPDTTDQVLQQGGSQQAADLTDNAPLLTAGAIASVESDGLQNPLPSVPEGAIAQTEPTEPATPERFGTVGQTYWYVQAGPSISYDRDDDGFAAFGLAGAGITDFFAHGHSINLELNKLKFIQPGDDAVGLNLGLLFRWHFVREEDWSLYVDGGAGFLVTSEDVPAEGGSQFNFTPQVGGGATFRMRNQEQLMVGLRWHHISNAELYPPNPGRDSILLYVGYLWPR